MKKVMILGAGLMQKPAILAAKKLGFEAAVADANPEAVCAKLADRFYPVDLKDKEGLLNLARELDGKEHELAGVFTAGTDFSASVAYVVQNTGLTGHSYEACLNASDKARMRRCFAEAGVPSPDFIEIEEKEINAVCEKSRLKEIRFPKVVKPCDNMGGRGCRLVRDETELESALKDAVSNSRTHRAIFEDYMEGPEFSIDAVVYEGTLTITGFADRHIYYPPYFIEMGHTMPSACESKIKNELIATFALGIQALGLTCGVAKADIKYTQKGPMIGEIAARLSGGYMSGWTYPYASAMNLTEEALKIAAGQKPDYLLANRISLPWQPHESVIEKDQPFDIYEVPCDLVSAERAWISIPGRVSEVTGLEDVTGIFGIRDVLPRCRAGDEVSFPRNNVSKCGNIISVGVNHEKAVKYAHLAVSNITMRLEPFNERTDAFLSGKCEEDEKGFPPSAFTFAPGQKGSFSGPGEGTVIPENAKVLPLMPETLLPLADSV
ncbi:MAG: ATP-grasp domain-containing protein, partial [Treponema sp.]|nr:ATP-grasp domain-containing protein [Treponema sp.]